MPLPQIISVSPLQCPPGAAIVVTGTGFQPGAVVACPAELQTGTITEGVLGAVLPTTDALSGNQALTLAVFVRNPDGGESNTITIELLPVYPAQFDPQSWTTLDAVAAEIPGFKRGGQIQDSTIQTWIRSIAQAVAGAMMRRNLPLDPAQWPQAVAGGNPTPAGVLELINRMGAAARLAAAVGANFGAAESGLAKSLNAAYSDEMKQLRDGAYDRLFSAGAATIDTGPQVTAGNIFTAGGDSAAAFRKDQVF